MLVVGTEPRPCGALALGLPPDSFPRRSNPARIRPLHRRQCNCVAPRPALPGH